MKIDIISPQRVTIQVLSKQVHYKTHYVHRCLRVGLEQYFLNRVSDVQIDSLSPISTNYCYHTDQGQACDWNQFDPIQSCGPC